MKKLPPEFYATGEDTPAEREIKTVDLGTLKTVDVTPRDGHSMRSLPHVSVDTLVRARLGARESAFTECRRACNRYWHGALFGAGAMFGVCSVAIGGVYAWLRWWR